MIEIGLAAYLTAHPQVAALAVSPSLNRIFPLIIPEHVRGEATKLSCLTYQRVGTVRSKTFCATDSLTSVQMQIDCYALTYLAAKRLADVLRKAMVDYTGPMGDTHVDTVSLDVEFDLFESETGLYRVSHTYTIWFIEE